MTQRFFLVAVALVCVGGSAGYGALHMANTSCLFGLVAAAAIIGAIMPEDFS